MSNGSVLTESPLVDDSLVQPSTSNIEQAIQELKIEDRDTLEDAASDDTIANGPGENDLPYMQYLPTEILHNVFQHFDCEDRSRASQVCQRWREILLNGNFPLPEVNVFNIFDYTIWKNQGPKTNRLRMFPLSENNELLHILRLVGESASIKIWYNNYSFAALCIDLINESKIKVKSIDMYPYKHFLPLNHLYNEFPNLSALCMRPHGQQYFFKGMDLQTMPEFPKMHTMTLDSFNIGPFLQFPESLTTLEFSHRDNDHVKRLIPKLRNVKNLEYLAISHGSLESMEDLNDFMDMISSLKNLFYLIFRFMRLPRQKGKDDGPIRIPAEIYQHTNALKMLRLELCYGNLMDFTELFVIASTNLQMVKLNILLDAASMNEVMAIANPLKTKKILLHCMALERDSSGTKNAEEAEQENQWKEFVFNEAFYSVCTHFEASFVRDRIFFDRLLQSAALVSFFEFKFIQCEGLNGEHLRNIAEKATRLRRLTVIGCKQIREEGFVPFVSTIRTRKSKELSIMWKSHNDDYTTLSMLRYLCTKESRVIPELMFFPQKKVLPEMSSGERYTIHDLKSGNNVVIKNYSMNDTSRVMGVIMPLESEHVQRPPSPSEEPSVTEDHTDSSLSSSD